MELAAILTGLSALVLLPLRLAQMEGFMAHHIEQLPPAPAGRSVTFIQQHCGFYAGDLIQSRADLGGDHLRLTTMGDDEDAAFVADKLGGGKIAGRTECATVWALN